MRAVIVGAGMGGLMTALALRQSGVFASVDIYEQTKVPSTAGAGFNVPPNAQDSLPVTETSLHPRRSTGAGLKFWTSTYSAGLFTLMISTERALVAVGGGFVALGTLDAVALGTAVSVGVGRVGVGLPVGEAVSVGNAVGTKHVSVGNGVNVSKPEPNKPVGVTCVPSVGKIFGLGVISEELRAGNTEISAEQRQQNTSRNSAGMSTLTA